MSIGSGTLTSTAQVNPTDLNPEGDGQTHVLNNNVKEGATKSRMLQSHAWKEMVPLGKKANKAPAQKPPPKPPAKKVTRIDASYKPKVPVAPGTPGPGNNSRNPPPDHRASNARVNAIKASSVGQGASSSGSSSRKADDVPMGQAGEQNNSTDIVVTTKTSPGAPAAAASDSMNVDGKSPMSPHLTPVNAAANRADGAADVGENKSANGLNNGLTGSRDATAPSPLAKVSDGDSMDITGALAENVAPGIPNSTRIETSTATTQSVSDGTNHALPSSCKTPPAADDIILDANKAPGAGPSMPSGAATPEGISNPTDEHPMPTSDFFETLTPRSKVAGLIPGTPSSAPSAASWSSNPHPSSFGSFRESPPKSQSKLPKHFRFDDEEDEGDMVEVEIAPKAEEDKPCLGPC